MKNLADQSGTTWNTRDDYAEARNLREQVVTIAFESVWPVLLRRARQERLLHLSSCSMAQ